MSVCIIINNEGALKKEFSGGFYKDRARTRTIHTARKAQTTAREKKIFYLFFPSIFHDSTGDGLLSGHCLGVHARRAIHMYH